MTEDTFDARLKSLLQAFRAHEDLRAQRADIGALARSNFALHQARMAMHHLNR